jgi:arylsulfatase A-like enzyme
VHEGGISTPLIAHWPNGIKDKGSLRHSPGHVIDIVPTILDLANIQKPKTWNKTPIPPAPGRSLIPSFASDQTIERDSIWWMHEGHRAIRQGDYKLVSAKNEPWALYDLKTDRAESNDLSKELPDLKKKLEKLWNNKVRQFKSAL